MSINQLNSLFRDFMPIFLIFELSKINYPRSLIEDFNRGWPAIPTNLCSIGCLHSKTGKFSDI